MSVRPTSSDWRPLQGRWSVQGDGLVAEPVVPDGAKAWARCSAHVAAPGRGCWSLRVRVDAVGGSPLNVGIEIDDMHLMVGPCEAKLVVNDFVEAFAPVAQADVARVRMEARLDERELTFEVDGWEVFRHRLTRHRPSGRVGLVTWSPTRFRDIQVCFDEPAGPTGRSKPASFRLACAVDFIDDARHCRFTPEMVRQYLRRLREMGVTRVYWEDYMRHILPDADLGQMRADLLREPGPGVWETFSQGWDDFTVAVEAGHELGLEVYALLKPFDWHYYEPSSREANYYPSMRFLYENQDKIMQRRPRPPGHAPDDAMISAIRLVSMSDAPLGFDLDALELWVSDDNASYRRYAGPMRVRCDVERRVFTDWWTGEAEPARRVCVVSLEGLELTARHLALRCEAESLSLRNRLGRLVEIEAVDGRPIEFTLATLSTGDTGDGLSLVRRSFKWEGNLGRPSAIPSGREKIEQFHAIDGDGWLGVTRGGMREPRRGWVTLCPAYDEVRDGWFMKLVRHALDAGADGIDLRAPFAHQRSFMWAEQNFNPPMIEAYRRRYGVDPSRDPYDRAKFAQLGGSFYDHFVEQASLLVRSRGKRIEHHVYHSWDHTPRDRPSMNLAIDWRGYLSKGWVDGIVLKEVFPGSAFFHEVMDLARDAGVEASACLFLNTSLNTMHNPRSAWREIVGGLVSQAREAGCDAMILYEGAGFIEGTSNGAVRLRSVDIPTVLAATVGARAVRELSESEILEPCLGVSRA